MANELRVRQNFLGGKVEDNPLSSSATTLTSAALAAAVAIGSTQHMPITLDPDGLGGEPEIVWVTAHSASATTATILRAQEGTTARAHNRDTDWTHGPTTKDVGWQEVLFRSVLTGTAASVDFPNIPASYESLRLEMLARSDQAVVATSLYLRNNGDSAANYDIQSLDVYSTTTTGSNSAGATVGSLIQIPGASAAAGEFASVVTDIPHYANTVSFKHSISRSAYRSSNGWTLRHEVGNWRSTAAINQLTVLPAAGNFVSGCIFTLYGIRGV